MKKETYLRLAAPFIGHPRRIRALCVLDRVLTYPIYVLYFLLLGYLLVYDIPRFWCVLLTTALGFALVTVLRKIVNEPRPYEAWELPSLLGKSKPGESFPSRHVFSVFVIAMAALWLCPWAGVVLLAVGTAMAAVRVIGGVHYPHDVLAGAALGVLIGWLGLWVLSPLFL